MNRVMKVVPLVILCALIIAVPSVWAYWVQDGVALCTAPGDQYYATITSDGAGGTFVTWQDRRSGSNDDIYAQRLNAWGTAQWLTDGVALCTAPGDQQFPQIISDGAGGAIVTWYDGRSGIYNIYAQRLNASGTAQWSSDGVALSTTAARNNYLLSPTIISDGGGGAIVTWQDGRSGSWDIYAQRVDASGAVQWTANGVALCAATLDQMWPAITSDGAGGAIVTWNDSRNGHWDTYAQRVNASGAVQWTADGVPLFTAEGGRSEIPTITSDGAGGAIVAWYDSRNGGWDIYAQRVNALGSAQWTTNGVALCTEGGISIIPRSLPMAQAAPLLRGGTDAAGATSVTSMPSG